MKISGFSLELARAVDPSLHDRDRACRLSCEAVECEPASLHDKVEVPLFDDEVLVASVVAERTGSSVEIFTIPP